MQTFLTLFVISFTVMAGAAFLLNACRRRAARTRHGLTGMCHESGGAMCGCCAGKLKAPANSPAKPSGRVRSN